MTFGSTPRDGGHGTRRFVLAAVSRGGRIERAGRMARRAGYLAVFALFCLGFFGVLAFLSMSLLCIGRFGRPPDGPWTSRPVDPNRRSRTGKPTVRGTRPAFASPLTAVPG